MKCQFCEQNLKISHSELRTIKVCLNKLCEFTPTMYIDKFMSWSICSKSKIRIFSHESANFTRIITIADCKLIKSINQYFQLPQNSIEAHKLVNNLKLLVNYI